MLASAGLAAPAAVSCRRAGLSPPTVRRLVTASYETPRRQQQQHEAACQGISNRLDELRGRRAAWQGQMQQGAGERRQQQRQHDRQVRGAAAAASAQACCAARAQRDQAVRALAEEQQRRHQQRASAAAQRARAAPQSPRHAPHARDPRHNLRTASSRSGTGSSSGGGGATSAGSSTSGTAEHRGGMHWAAYSRQWHRFYDAQVDADDCWGRKPSGSQRVHATNAAEPDAQGQTASSGQHFGAGPTPTAGSYNGSFASDPPPGSSDAYWQQFAGGASSSYGYQQAYGSGSWTAEGTGWSSLADVLPPGGSAVEQQARAELAAVLARSGGDLCTFVAALGIPFKQSADRHRSLRNARAAALLQLHPDRLQQRSERQQAFGALATRVLHELWKAAC